MSDELGLKCTLCNDENHFGGAFNRNVEPLRFILLNRHALIQNSVIRLTLATMCDEWSLTNKILFFLDAHRGHDLQIVHEWGAPFNEGE